MALPIFLRGCALCLMVLSITAACSADLLAARRDRLAPTACTTASSIPGNGKAAAATPVVLSADLADDAAGGAGDTDGLVEGEPADAETVAQITAFAQEFAGCLNETADERLATMMTEQAVVNVGSTPDRRTAILATVLDDESNSREIAWVRVREVQQEAGDSVSAVIEWGVPYDDQAKPAPRVTVQTFQHVGGQWLLADISGDVEWPETSGTPTVSTSPPMSAEDLAILSQARQGFNEVDSAVYVEPTMAGAKFTIEGLVMVGFLGNDDYGAVSCELFVIERGADSAVVSAFCRAEDDLAGRAAYLEVNAYGSQRGSEMPPHRCEDIAPLSAMVRFSCTVEIPELAN